MRYERVEPCEHGKSHPRGCFGDKRTGLEPTTPDYEAAAKAMTAKLKEHPVPAPQYGSTVGASYFWGVTVEEVARVAVDAALVGKVVIDAESTEKEGEN